MISGRRILWLLGSLAAFGCRPASSPVDASTELRTGALVDSRHLRCDFGWDQEVTATYGPLSHSFEVLVECAEGTLTVVGLTPYQTRAFTLIQRGLELETIVDVPGALPFPPENVLYDLHRALFWGFSSDPRENLRSFGDLERRHDRFVAGRLRERLITRLSDPTERVRIVYAGGYLPTQPPPEIQVTNEKVGYALRIVTLASTRTAAEDERPDRPE